MGLWIIIVHVNGEPTIKKGGPNRSRIDFGGVSVQIDARSMACRFVKFECILNFFALSRRRDWLTADAHASPICFREDTHRLAAAVPAHRFHITPSTHRCGWPQHWVGSAAGLDGPRQRQRQRQHQQQDKGARPPPRSIADDGTCGPVLLRRLLLLPLPVFTRSQRRYQRQHRQRRQQRGADRSRPRLPAAAAAAARSPHTLRSRPTKVNE